MFGEPTSTVLMVAGVALAACLLLRGVWGRRASRASHNLSPRRGPGSSAGDQRDLALADAPPDILRWQVEMHETARDLKAEIDSKLAALQALTALARQERERLEAAIERAAARSVEPRAGALALLESLGDPAALDDPQRLAAVAAALPPLPGDIDPQLFSRDRASLAVGRLADQGLPPTQISQHLGVPVGEVELLLSLRST